MHAVGGYQQWTVGEGDTVHQDSCKPVIIGALLGEASRSGGFRSPMALRCFAGQDATLRAISRRACSALATLAVPS
jgi:hypothetical protein